MYTKKLYIERFSTESLAQYFGELKVHFIKYKYGWLAFLVSMALLSKFIYFGVAFDHSLPGDHFYVVMKWDKNVGREDKVAFPSKGGHVGPPEGIILVKYVRGVPGDQITLGGSDGRDVFVNGSWVAHAKERSRDFKPLSIAKPGVVPEGYIFVVNPSTDSFDSRYADVGYIAKDRIIGRALTVF